MQNELAQHEAMGRQGHGPHESARAQLRAQASNLQGARNSMRSNLSDNH